jgi:hypothetical protein
MFVHRVLSGVFQGVGYEAGALRVVLKDGRAYDYLNVSEEDCGLFMRNFGKVYNSVIKKKYKCVPVTDVHYSPE